MARSQKLSQALNKNEICIAVSNESGKNSQYFKKNFWSVRTLCTTKKSFFGSYFNLFESEIFICYIKCPQKRKK